jgi:hypothetical protein
MPYAFYLFLIDFKLFEVGNKLVSITFVIVRLFYVRPKYTLLSLTLSLTTFNFYKAEYPRIVPVIMILI